VIGSHNKPPPPSYDKVFIAAVNGEPEIPLDVPTLGKEKELDGGIDIEGEEPLVGNVGIELGVSKLNGDELVGIELDGIELDGGIPDGEPDEADKAIGGNPDAILEYSIGSIPGGTGNPEASAAATISAGVGSKVPVITL
jgi:hypothetical protein